MPTEILFFVTFEWFSILNKFSNMTIKIDGRSFFGGNGVDLKQKMISHEIELIKSVFHKVPH